MKRTKLSQRHLPNYSRGEEIMNMVTHIVGGGLAVIGLIACLIRAAMVFACSRFRNAFFFILSFPLRIENPCAENAQGNALGSPGWSCPD